MADVDKAPRFGTELKDGFKSVNTWVSNGIAWLEDQQQFYRERSTIEREYSSKLSALAKKYFEKKAKRSSGLSVGDSPTLTPGSLESASLIAWTAQLTTLEARAAEHSRFGLELQQHVAEPLKIMATRYEELRKSHADYAIRLERERDASYSDLRKTKARYDGACQDVENKRRKTESSFDHGKNKAQVAYQQQLVEMHNVKNTYLIGINVTNKQKHQYYYNYVPELLDNLQDLGETRIAQVNQLWTSAANLERSTLSRSMDNLEHLNAQISRNEPYLDSTMFVRHNVTAWQEPSDVSFEPSPVWLDDGVMVIDEASKVFLRNVLGKSKSQLRELKQESDKRRREVESLRRSRQKIREGQTDKDEIELYHSLFSVQEDLHQVEKRRFTAEIETQTVISTVGDLSVGAQNHNFRPETFKIPTNCDHCGDRIWGLSAKGLDCQVCGYTCHKQCELKVPPECPGEQSKEERKKLKIERQASAKAVPATINGAPSLHGSGVPSRDRSSTMDTLSSGHASRTENLASAHPPDQDLTAETGRQSPPAEGKPAASLRHRVLAPPPARYTSEDPSDELTSANTASPTAEPQGRMLYSFQATNEGEVSVSEGSHVSIVEHDDGSGWTAVKSGHETGLVPTSYLEKQIEPLSKTLAPSDRPVSSFSSSTTSLAGSTHSGGVTGLSNAITNAARKKGPAVAPKRGAKKLKYVEAMYDYEARSDAEWSMNEGEKFVCINRDTGDGWADVERGGIVKSVPANYIQDV